MLNAYKLDEVGALVDGRYVPARPYVGPGGFLGLHWREAWLVLLGRRHAVHFPGQEGRE